MMLLQDKTIVLGVTGGIAAYKAADLVSRLKKLGAQVRVIMTQAATEFVTPLTFQALSQYPVAVSMFDEPHAWEIRHISLAKAADVLAVVPCTANVIAKAAHGIGDDMLTTTMLATKAPLLIAPAMNTNMYENSVVQDNIRILKERGVLFAAPAEGRLACGDTGSGKLADISVIVQLIAAAALRKSGDLKGKKFVVTAGPTQEALDPVRYLTNHSSGKMGYALAQAAYYRGADVTLVAGPNHLPPLAGVHTIPVVCAQEMYQSVLEQAKEADVVIKAAAVADFRPACQSGHKLKKGTASLNIALTANPDILEELGKRYGGQKLLVGFCMETQNLLENAHVKLQAKHADLMVANSLTQPGAGFDKDTNVVTILDRSGGSEALPLMSKDDTANAVLDRIAALL